jgi:nucleolar protein 4
MKLQVTLPDIASAFASFGPIQTIRLLKGYAFITFITKASAQAALEGMNNKRIYAGMEKDRIQEAASHELTSIKRKKEKGKIVGVKGRMCAVDWALEKEQYMKLEAEANRPTSAPEVAGELKNGIEHDPDAPDSDEEDEEEDSDEDEDEEDDLTPEPIDMNELEPPSEAELSDEDAGKDGDANKAKATDEGTTLFVRNIQFEATEDELYNL